jgi:30S ribosomal protein S31
MGKGDIRTAKGKRVRGSYGNSRRKKETIPTVVAAPAKKVSAKTEEKVEKKPAVKKAPVAKKATDAPKKAPAKKAPVKKAESTETK